ncbi:MAG: DUF58 domain-containing protein [Gammaproteobacteria bacterium]|nr:MAG: DUF58 domain-containing protein [Gammaproteobacteria bacterium]
MLQRLFFKNFHLAYRFDQWVRQRFTPMGMIILSGAIASGMFAVDTRRTLAYQLLMLAAVVVVLGMVAAPFFRARIQARRRLPRLATVGEGFEYTVALTNRGQRVEKGLFLSEALRTRPPTFEEFARTELPGGERMNWFDRYVGYPRWAWLMNRNRGARVAAFALPDLLPGAETPVRARLTPTRRGYLRFAGFSLLRPDPLGIFNARVRLKQAESLLVLPKTYEMPALSLPGNRRYQRGGVALASSVGDSQEFMSLREYRPGDPTRHIHWRSWARLGEPVVKEFQDEFFVRQALILDTFMGHRGSRRFEEAVSVAASLARNLSGRESLVDLAFVGDKSYYFTAGRGVAQTERLLEILACVDVCMDQSFDALPRVVMEHAARLSSCTCVLLEWDEARQRLVEALNALGVPVRVFVLQSSDVNEKLDTGPMAAQAHRLHALQVGQVEAGLLAAASAEDSTSPVPLATQGAA